MAVTRSKKALIVVTGGTAALASLVWITSFYIDFEYIAWMFRREFIERRPVETCLDYPEKYWRRIPKCYELYKKEKPGSLEDEPVG